MASIRVTNDAAAVPTVTLQTIQSGPVIATLAKGQPYEEQSKLTTIDRYLFEAPLDPQETFFMVKVTGQVGT